MQTRFRQRWHLVVLLLTSCQLLYAEAPAHEAADARAIALSVAFPGLGQLAAGHRAKGTALVATSIVSLVGWLTSHADYNTQSAQFALERERYLALQNGGSFDEAEKSWQRLDNLKSALDGSHLRRHVFGVLAAGVYGYNLLDVLLLDGASPATKQRMHLAPLPQASGVLLIARF